jgi:hypothetical protein
MKGQPLLSPNSQLVTPTDRALHTPRRFPRASDVEILDHAATTLRLPRPRRWLTFVLVAVACIAAATIGLLVRLGLDQRFT